MPACFPAQALAATDHEWAVAAQVRLRAQALQGVRDADFGKLPANALGPPRDFGGASELEASPGTDLPPIVVAIDQRDTARLRDLLAAGTNPNRTFGYVGLGNREPEKGAGPAIDAADVAIALQSVNWHHAVAALPERCCRPRAAFEMSILDAVLRTQL
jgi:hypothetical protein